MPSRWSRILVLLLVVMFAGKVRGSARATTVKTLVELAEKLEINARKLVDAGYISKGVEYYNLIISTYRRLDSLNLASESSYRFARQLMDLSEVDLSLHYLHQAVEFYQQMQPPDRKGLVNAWIRIGNGYMRKDDPETAFIHFDAAIETARELNPCNNRTARALTNAGLAWQTRGTAALRQQDSVAARRYFAKAEQCQREALEIKKYHAKSTDVRIAIVEVNFGDHFLTVGRTDSAMTYFDRAIQVFERNRSQHLPAALTSMAEAYAQRNDAGTAFGIYERALALMIRENENNRRDIAKIILAMTDLQMRLGDANAALESSHYALNTLYPALSRDSLAQLPKRDWLYGEPQVMAALAAKGDALRAGGHHAAALDCYLLAIRVVDLLRSDLQSIQAAIHRSEDAVSYYEKAMHAAFAAGRAGQVADWQSVAFDIAERSKGNLLYRKWMHARGESARKQDDLHTRAENLQRQLERARRQDLGADVATLASQLAIVQDSIALLDPEWARIVYGTSENICTRLQDQLDDTTAVLQFFAADSVLYACALSRDTLVAVSSPLDAALLRSITIFERTVRKDDLARNQSQAELDQEWMDFCRSGRALFQTLFEPLNPVLERLQGAVPRLVIAHDGFMGHLPFELLLRAPVDTALLGSYQNLPYMLRNFAMSYVFAAEQLVSSSSPNSSSSDSSDKTSAEVTFFAPMSDPAAKPTVGYLQGSRKEGNSIFSLTDGRRFLDAEATIDTFLTMRDAPILHLCTHAQASSAAFGDAWVQFFGPLSAPSRLYLDDIYGIQLTAKMVVLSACNTARGKSVRGEGILSMAHAFTYAGADAVLMSLWKAADGTSPDLMKTYYAGLAEGLTKDRALRRAKLTHLEAAYALNASPQYWANYVVIGDTAPIKLAAPASASCSWLWWTLPLLIVAGSSIWWWVRRRKRIKD